MTESDDKHVKRRRQFDQGMRIVAITLFSFMIFIAVWKRSSRIRQRNKHGVLPPSRFLRHSEKHAYDITKRHEGDLIQKIHHLHAREINGVKKITDSKGKLVHGIDLQKKYKRANNPK
jgi:hypothetical protein